MSLVLVFKEKSLGQQKASEEPIGCVPTGRGRQSWQSGQVSSQTGSFPPQFTGQPSCSHLLVLQIPSASKQCTKKTPKNQTNQTKNQTKKPHKNKQPPKNPKSCFENKNPEIVPSSDTAGNCFLPFISKKKGRLSEVFAFFHSSQQSCLSWALTPMEEKSRPRLAAPREVTPSSYWQVALTRAGQTLLSC